MRIAFFTTRMMLGYGVDLTVHEIARRLVETHGHDVDVWTPTSDGTYKEEAYNLREIIVHGNNLNRVLAILEMNARRAIRKLRGRLSHEGQRYDIIVSCTHPYYAAGRILGIPGVFFNFGNVPTTGFTLKGKLNWQWLDLSERLDLKPRSAAVVSISRFLNDKQCPPVRRKGRVVHLGGDHYFPAAAGAGEKFRAEHGIPQDAVVFGYCGRLHRDHPPYKGTGVVLDIGRKIRGHYPDSRLVMCGIGSPDDRAWVESTGAVAVMNLPPAGMPGFYSALDVYLCASRWEGFNLPIVEAAWHGVPSVAYDAGAHGEHVTQVLVPDGDEDALYQASLRLAGDRSEREKLAKQASHAARGFSWDRCTREFNAILEGVRG